MRALAQAGVPTTTTAEDVAVAAAAGGRTAAVVVALCARPDAAGRGGGGDAAALRRSAAPIRSPSGGCDRACAASRWPVATAVRPASCSSTRCVTPRADPLNDRWTEPAKAVAKLLAIAQETAAKPAATAEDVLWAVWQASGLADRWAAASARAVAGRPRRP
jgi:hypothetical protein